MGKRQYKLDEAYFDVVDTPQKAYFLGILYADGYNNEAKGSVHLSQNESHKDILDKLKVEIGSTSPYTIVSQRTSPFGNQYKVKKQIRLNLYSRHLSNSLSKLGVVSNKTHVLKFPKELPELLIPHFIRGYFDGDGYVGINENYYNRAHISITGNDLFIKEVKSIIDIRFSLSGHLNVRHVKSPNIVTLSYSGTKSCVSILSWLYRDAGELYIEKKHGVFLKARKIQLGHLEEKERLLKNKLTTELENSRRANQKKQNEEQEEQLIIQKLDEGYSIRQIWIQFGIDKRRIRKIIDKVEYNYGTRRRMFEKDPNKNG